MRPGLDLLPLIDPALFFLRGACVFFNVLLSAWLGVTVVLNARQRTGPIRFAGICLIFGAIFFGLYAVGLGASLRSIAPLLVGPAGALAVLVLLFLPLAWFLVVLHYAGFREAESRLDSGRRRRIRLQLWIAICLWLACMLAAALTLAGLLQAKASNSVFYVYRIMRGWEVRCFLLLFGLHVLASTGFAFQILLGAPFAAGGVRGLARSKARRPMRRAGGMLFLLAWGVAALVCLFFVAAHGRARPTLLFWLVLFRFDALAAAQVTFVIYYVGRAIVSYEIFSGTVLPERSLERQWKNAVSFSCFYAFFGAGLFFVSHRAALAALGGGLLATLFLIRLGWRLRNERALHARTLRPFLGSQDLYGTVLRETVTERSASDSPARQTFERFCDEVLESRYAALVPVGATAALIARPLIYRAASMPLLDELELEAGCLRIAEEIRRRTPPDGHDDPAENFVVLKQDSGFIAALPLWSDRRTVGVLLLGEKQRGGVYTLEEVEIAQAAGERLIDVLAAARLAQVLRDLERARLAEMGLSDDRARRILHDEILPEVHALMLRLDARDAATVETLAGVHRRISALLHRMPGAHPDLGAGLVPALRGLSSEVLGVDRLVLDIEESAESFAAGLPAIKTEVLYFAVREAVRNATRYARRSGRPLEILLRLYGSTDGGPGLVIDVQDNGPAAGDRPRGASDANADASGGHTSTGGAGRGLALHGAMIAVIGGSLEFERVAGGGRLRLVLEA